MLYEDKCLLTENDRRHSYSASQMLATCERKYYYKYILGVAQDADAVDDPRALLFGKTFHKVCEDTQHDGSQFKMEMLDRAAFENNLEAEDKFGVYACLVSYYSIHKTSKLFVRAIESEIGDDTFVGYVDAILMDINGNWRICDLKTSGMIVEQLFARLHKDPQLNFYGAYAGQLAEKYGLDLSRLVGCSYRVVQKSRSKPKAGESMAAYAARVAPEAYSIEVPIEMMNFQESYENMVMSQQKGKSLTFETAKCNRKNCLDWNRPCEYWSQCHGKTYTECKDSAKVFTKSTMIDLTLPKRG